MTAPNQGDPNGALNPGDFAGFQSMTQADAQTAMTSGAKVSINDAFDSHKNNVTDRIDGNYTLIQTTQGSADQAVTTAQAAANTAAAASEKADIAYGLSSYWEAECVVASAAVVLGVNELLIGLCQNVPDDRARKITDLHFALLTQPAGITIETKKWNAAGTTSTVIHTAVLGANVTRINYNTLDLPMEDKERIFWNITSITGTTAPTVLQVLAFGVIL
ncbi:hypothetical protein [Nocardia africana]